MSVKPELSKHRTTYSGGVKAQEHQTWGRDTARSRYVSPQCEYGAPPPKDQSYPQFRQDQRGPDWADDTANDWRRGAGEDATTKPNFDSCGSKGYHGRRA